MAVVPPDPRTDIHEFLRTNEFLVRIPPIPAREYRYRMIDENRRSREEVEFIQNRIDERARIMAGNFSRSLEQSIWHELRDLQNLENSVRPTPTPNDTESVSAVRNGMGFRGQVYQSSIDPRDPTRLNVSITQTPPPPLEPIHVNIPLGMPGMSQTIQSATDHFRTSRSLADYERSPDLGRNVHVDWSAATSSLNAWKGAGLSSGVLDTDAIKHIIRNFILENFEINLEMERDANKVAARVSVLLKGRDYGPSEVIASADDFIDLED